MKGSEKNMHGNGNIENHVDENKKRSQALTKYFTYTRYFCKFYGNKSHFLSQKPDIRAWRARYLQRLKQNDDLGAGKKPVIYIDETNHNSGQKWIVVHGGGENGFVNGAELIYKCKSNSGDYHHEMNTANFKKWILEKLIPYLPLNSIVVLDNAPYHSTQIEKPPTSVATKGTIRQWLLDHNITFDERMTKSEIISESDWIKEVNHVDRLRQKYWFTRNHIKLQISCQNLTNAAAWVSLHIVVVYSGPSSPMSWSSHFGYVSLITTFLRIVRANLGRPVTSNALARAYISMLKGYLRDTMGCVAAENAFIRDDISDETLSEAFQLLQQCAQPPHPETDSYIDFGQYISTELRKYDAVTLVNVKNAINQVIFQADTGRYGDSNYGYYTNSYSGTPIAYTSSQSQSLQPQNYPAPIPQTSASAHLASNSSQSQFLKPQDLQKGPPDSPQFKNY
ncbi:hypothetical protein HW555_005071 [Spodoptera exigua]|uniref:Tc1-like transposase DDE domain-containing protein n=1 Tax=Spodoptera exigua TaxID=7107 RepID=A0A835GH28_SPOEX|nr:hypothetical protein HW555_005071 [Spodoptera exigua]